MRLEHLIFKGSFGKGQCVVRAVRPWLGMGMEMLGHRCRSRTSARGWSPPWGQEGSGAGHSSTVDEKAPAWGFPVNRGDETHWSRRSVLRASAPWVSHSWVIADAHGQALQRDAESLPRPPRPSQLGQGSSLKNSNESHSFVASKLRLNQSPPSSSLQCPAGCLHRGWKEPDRAPIGTKNWTEPPRLGFLPWLLKQFAGSCTKCMRCPMHSLVAGVRRVLLQGNSCSKSSSITSGVGDRAVAGIDRNILVWQSAINRLQCARTQEKGSPEFDYECK